MQDEIKTRYEFSSWGQKRPGGPSTIFVAFSPAKEDCFGWELCMTCSEKCGEDSRLSRTIWNSPESPDSRVLIDVYVGPSDASARDCLVNILARNHLRIVPTGPDNLGDKSFVYPEVAPRYLCWVRDNLCIVTSSFGKEAVEVIEVAARLDARLVDSYEEADHCLELSVENPIAVGSESRIRYSLPWQVEDSSFARFVASGAELFLKGESVCLRATTSGEARIAGFASRPGQSPCRGATVIAIA